MNRKHWSDDELIGRLYGVGPEDNHLDDCAECGERSKALAASRRGVVMKARDIAIDPASLLRQRMRVMDRIEHSTGGFLSWRAVTAFAGATAMVLGFLVYHPRQPKPVVAVTQTASSDAQFFSEIYSEVEQTEPRAMKPMRQLFQERP